MSSSKRPPAPKPANVDFRSAVSGRFVKEQFAKTHPDTTVREVNKTKK
jgi:hypothetical protein